MNHHEIFEREVAFNSLNTKKYDIKKSRHI